jgi:hypothetical protein
VIATLFRGSEGSHSTATKESKKSQAHQALPIRGFEPYSRRSKVNLDELSFIA